MNDRHQTDPEQWRALMALPDDALLRAWQQADADCALARRQGEGVHDAILWRGLIEGAAASRFGVGPHLARYRALDEGQAPG